MVTDLFFIIKKRETFSIIFILLVLSACSTLPTVQSPPVNPGIKAKYLSILFRNKGFWEINTIVKQMTESVSVFDATNGKWSPFEIRTGVEFTENGLIEKEESHMPDNHTIFQFYFKGDYPVKSSFRKGEEQLMQTAFYYNKQGELVLKKPVNSDKSSRTVKYLYFGDLIIAHRQKVSIVYKMNSKKQIIETFVVKTLIKSPEELKFYSPGQRMLYHYNADNQLEKTEKISSGTVIKSVRCHYNENGNKTLVVTMSGKPELKEKNREIFSHYKYDEHGNWIERTIESQVKHQNRVTGTRKRELRSYQYF